MIRIAIIGAGAAGLMAAHFAAKGETAEITLYEKNPVCGKKVRITGKGRCNVTTATPVPEMEPMLPRGGKFLRTALYAFSPEACRAFFEEAGVPLKVERGARVFPVSDRAADIVSALVKRALESPRVKKKQEKVLEEVLTRHDEVEQLLADPAVYADGAKATELLKEFHELQERSERELETLGELEAEIAELEAKRAALSLDGGD